tara:strand:- start:412 stop:774 length:363 start_codon:yes stop_codon:yes gene_type:complete
MSWWEVFKNKQILTPTTDINIKKVPKKPKTDKCCQEAKEKYIKAHVHGMLAMSRTSRNHPLNRTEPTPKSETDLETYERWYSQGGAAGMNCERFRKWLNGLSSTTSKQILREWVDCEGSD